MSASTRRYRAEGFAWGALCVDRLVAIHGPEMIVPDMSEARVEAIAAPFRTELEERLAGMFRFKTKPQLIEAYARGALGGFLARSRELMTLANQANENTAVPPGSPP
jgi:hypothetical protein